MKAHEIFVIAVNGDVDEALDPALADLFIRFSELSVERDKLAARELERRYEALQAEGVELTGERVRTNQANSDGRLRGVT